MPDPKRILEVRRHLHLGTCVIYLNRIIPAAVNNAGRLHAHPMKAALCGHRGEPALPMLRPKALDLSKILH